MLLISTVWSAMSRPLVLVAVFATFDCCTAADAKRRCELYARVLLAQQRLATPQEAERVDPDPDKAQASQLCAPD